MEENGRLITKELDLFEKPHDVKDIERRFWVDFKSVTPLSGEFCCVDFIIPGTSQNYIDLKNSFLQVKVAITNEDGSHLLASDKVSPSNLLLHAMFAQVDISLGQTTISSSVGSNYPYQALFNVLENSSSQAERTYLPAEGYVKETNFVDVSQSLSYFLNGKKICKRRGGAITRKITPRFNYKSF